MKKNYIKLAVLVIAVAFVYNLGLGHGEDRQRALTKKYRTVHTTSSSSIIKEAKDIGLELVKIAVNNIK